MRDEGFLVVAVCCTAAACAVMYAATTGATWPLPFAIFVVVIGGVIHLSAANRRNP